MPGRTCRNDKSTGGCRKKKLISFAIWLSGVDRLDCETCQSSWADFKGSPPCASCKPDLDLENIEAVNIYQQCSGQWITGQQGLIDINIVAVIEVMELRKVEDKEACLEKVQLIVSKILKIWNN